MVVPTFIQKSRIGRSIFQLREDVLETTQTIFGRKQQTRIPLKTLTGDYDRIVRRYPLLYAVPLALCIPCLWIIYLILNQDAVPHIFAFYPGIFGLSFIIAAIRGMPPIDSFRFYNYWKQPVFDIVRERRQADECDAFVQELLKRIGHVENNLSVDWGAKIENGGRGTLTSSDGLYPLRTGEHYWKASILMGAFSAGLPWVTRLAYMLQDFQFFLVFGATVGGLVLCVLSFQAKERFRYVSLLGATLSLIAPLCY